LIALFATAHSCMDKSRSKWRSRSTTCRSAIQYFRYPFLRQGNTIEKRDAVLSWMASRGIVVAPVTIDNNDYEYNQRLVDAKG
jgi:hypothetical protein